jgi:hypothetical protein
MMEFVDGFKDTASIPRKELDAIMAEAGRRQDALQAKLNALQTRYDDALHVAGEWVETGDYLKREFGKAVLNALLPPLPRGGLTCMDS